MDEILKEGIAATLIGHRIALRAIFEALPDVARLKAFSRMNVLLEEETDRQVAQLVPDTLIQKVRATVQDLQTSGLPDSVLAVMRQLGNANPKP